ncbi:MAG: succinyl-diaminopimelate desuccinylase [PS1 clade bacterium]|jgi:succinyl-diaminopimelate desuccinylase
MSKTIELAQDLISRSSISPEDGGCQAVLIEILSDSGFLVDNLKFGEVDNFWATHGSSGPVFVFAGHTDVVPVGDRKKWLTDPFIPTIKGDLLYGRGASDMKGGLASMTVAAVRFVNDFPNHKGTIGFLITSDEEGPAIDGTVKVAHHLKGIGQKVDYCLVGEPSSTSRLGDVIKNGRRGSINGRITIIGKQGHIAYPHLAINPIHLAVPALKELCDEVWDEGNEFFDATSFQISNINSGTGATNVTPGETEVLFNFRYSTETTDEELKEKLCNILDKHELNYDIDWGITGDPFLTPPGDLVTGCVSAIRDVISVEPELSTSGGTSDGRFIAPILGAQVVELGPINATIHQVNENVSVKDLDDLTDIYYQILKNILL